MKAWEIRPVWSERPHTRVGSKRRYAAIGPVDHIPDFLEGRAISDVISGKVKDCLADGSADGVDHGLSAFRELAYEPGHELRPTHLCRL